MSAARERLGRTVCKACKATVVFKGPQGAAEVEKAIKESKGLAVSKEVTVPKELLATKGCKDYSATRGPAEKMVCKDCKDITVTRVRLDRTVCKALWVCKGQRGPAEVPTGSTSRSSRSLSS